METLSSPIIMHSNALESKCLQLDAGMVHTYPLVTKNKRPNQNKTIQKSIIKNAKAQHRTAGWKNPAGPGTERAPAVCSAREQPETGLTSQPKVPKRFWN